LLSELTADAPLSSGAEVDRNRPPPRPGGKTFNTAVVDDEGRTRLVEIRRRDQIAETRVDGRIVPPEQVLVHRRGVVEILDAKGQPELSFRLPRGMTSVTQSGR